MSEPKDDNDSFPGILQEDGSYVVDLSQMEDVQFFQARLPGFKPEEGEPIIPEKISASTPLAPLDVVLFFDKRSKHPAEDGVNQQGYVVDDTRALFLRNRVHSISLDELRSQPNALVVRAFHPEIGKLAAAKLLQLERNPVGFGFATNFLKCSNFYPFVTGTFFPDDPIYGSKEDYEAAWCEMVKLIEPQDLVLTFDRRSIISKIVARVTHGPFSHVAHYIDNGKIWEVVTSGTRIVPLETYKGPHYRVAIYRHSPGRFLTSKRPRLNGGERPESRVTIIVVQ